jgi:hypothetical protein
MDGSTTYCYYMGEKYSQELPSEDDVLVSDTGSKCPITIRVDVADELTRNEIIPIRYTATLDTDNADADFEFPDPIVQAVVPSYLASSSSNSSTSGSSSSTTYDVPVANVVICDWRTCDIFTASDDSSNYYSSSNNPNDFDSTVAVFGSQELILPKDGKYTGYVHLVVNIAGNSRADFVTFFPVQIGDVAGTAPSSIVADGTTTYCWTAEDISPFDPSVSGSLTVRTGENCPGTMSMGLSSTSLEVDDTINIAWKLDMSGVTTDDSTLIGEVSTTDAIEDPRTAIWSVVPVAVFSGCQKNAVGANCSTYSGDESTTFDIAEFDDSNLTSDAVTYSTNYTFSDSGQYTMIGRVAMMTVDGERLDMAVYSTVTVSVPDGSSTSSVFLYVGVGIGCAILLLGLLFCFLRKRRNKVNTKNIPFREPTAILATGREGRGSQYTVASSNFLTHKTPSQNRGTTQLSGAGYTSSDPNSIVLSDYSVSGQQNYYAQPSQQLYGQHSDQYHEPQQQQQHRGDESFSLDPYDRASFADLASESDAESVARPSDMAKFSFQSGFDDETEWEYDMRPTHEILGGITGSSQESTSQLSDLSSEADLHRGTFDLARGMPILEEDVDDGQHRERGLSGGSNDPRSTSSSRWTINTH